MFFFSNIFYLRVILHRAKTKIEKKNKKNSYKSTFWINKQIAYKTPFIVWLIRHWPSFSLDSLWELFQKSGGAFQQLIFASKAGKNAIKLGFYARHRLQRITTRTKYSLKISANCGRDYIHNGATGRKKSITALAVALL